MKVKANNYYFGDHRLRNSQDHRGLAITSIGLDNYQAYSAALRKVVEAYWYRMRLFPVATGDHGRIRIGFLVSSGNLGIVNGLIMLSQIDSTKISGNRGAEIVA